MNISATRLRHESLRCYDVCDVPAYRKFPSFAPGCRDCSFECQWRQAFTGSPLRAEEQVYRDHWAEFPYDLAEFVSPWQGFRGGDSFFTGKCEVADRKVTEIAGISARGQSGDWALMVV